MHWRGTPFKPSRKQVFNPLIDCDKDIEPVPSGCEDLAIVERAQPCLAAIEHAHSGELIRVGRNLKGQ
jgi:hypothetical protein